MRRGSGSRAIGAIIKLKAFTEFDVAGNIVGFPDETVQGILLPVKVGNQGVANGFIKAAEVMMRHSLIGFIGLISKLENKHFELSGVFACSTLPSLADGFSAFDDIGLAVGHKVLFLESFDEILKRYRDSTRTPRGS